MSDAPETPAVQTQDSSPPVARAGWSLWFRLFAVATLPLILLGVTGVLVSRSLALGGLDLSTPEFQLYFLGALCLAVLLGTLLATWLHLALRARLLALQRALAEERTQEIQALEHESGWGLFSDLARHASELLSRSHDAQSEASTLAELRGSLGALVAGIEEWAATESSHALVLDERLGPLSTALGTLRARLGERDAEASSAAEATMETAREGRAAVELALREAKKATLEASFVRTDLAALRHDWAAAERVAAAGAVEPGASDADSPSLETEHLQAACSALRARLEDEERRALSLALVLAAARLKAWGGELAGQSDPGVAAAPAEGDSLVGTLSSAAGGLREIALACRTLGEEALRLETALGRRRTASQDEALPRTESAPSGFAEDSLRAQLAVVEQRGERLAALCERVERHAARAILAAQAVEDDIAGLATRFEVPPAPAGADAAESSAEVADPERPRTGPLRLLTRDDVLVEDEGGEAETPDSGTSSPADSADGPSGGTRGDG